mgnify:CR=1 FL=1
MKKGSVVRDIYKTESITERHRHRYEFNGDYKERIEAAGMIATGLNPDTGLVEIIEIPDHPWFVGVQYHPEYKSTVANPHPLFVAFVKASLIHKKKKNNSHLSKPMGVTLTFDPWLISRVSPIIQINNEDNIS